MRITGVILAAALSSSFLVGCGGDESLAQRDPHGYEACSALAESYKAGEVGQTLTQRFEALREAAKSSTEAIQEAAGSDSSGMDEEAEEVFAEAGIPLGDVPTLIKACEAEGFDIPDEEK